MSRGFFAVEARCRVGPLFALPCGKRAVGIVNGWYYCADHKHAAEQTPRSDR